MENCEDKFVFEGWRIKSLKSLAMEATSSRKIEQVGKETVTSSPHFCFLRAGRYSPIKSLTHMPVISESILKYTSERIFWSSWQARNPKNYWSSNLLSLGQSQPFFLRPSNDWMRSIHIVEASALLKA